MPLILVSPDFARPGTSDRERVMLNLGYLECLARAGATTVIATPQTDVGHLRPDGWLITGGDDFPGELLGQKTHPDAKPAHPLRLGLEQRLLEEVGDIPILGICFGSQFLALTSGGRLQQHLPDLIGHDRHTDGETTVRLEQDEFLGFRKEFKVRCSHHQAIEEPPPGWAVVARSTDGVIEGIAEESARFRVGIQWHPERTPDSPETIALFKEFVSACSNRR